MVVVLVTSVPIHAQIASALLREGQTVPGDSSDLIVDRLGTGKVQNGVGGFGFRFRTNDGVWRFWGSVNGNDQRILRSPETIGNFQQTSFGNFGMDDSGSIGYTASFTDLSSGQTGLSGTWLDSTLVLGENDSIPSIPGSVVESFYGAGAGMTYDGTHYWQARYNLPSGEAGVALLFGPDSSVRLKSGDSVSGIAESIDFVSAAIASTDISAFGTNYISRVRVNSGSQNDDTLLVSNGAALMAGNSFVREGEAVPISIGGRAGDTYTDELWAKINEDGSYVLDGTIQNSVSENISILMLDGQIVMREGDSIDGWTLAGLDSGVHAGINEDGDWTQIWQLESMNGVDQEALFFNEEIRLLTGDSVDWNNDGIINHLDENAFIVDFFSSPSIGDRDINGNVRILFHAVVDVNGTELQGAFSTTYSTVPEPAGFVLMLAGSVLGLIRRRSRAE